MRNLANEIEFQAVICGCGCGTMATHIFTEYGTGHEDAPAALCYPAACKCAGQAAADCVYTEVLEIQPSGNN